MPKYNERSWAIDLIGHIKKVSASLNRSIKDAGGEHTVNTASGRLFPDVLLFGDRANASILQGWELKMPDTSINDVEFYDNAKRKALTLGLNSFILWNVTFARLFIKKADNSDFYMLKEWDDLKEINSREDVVLNKSRWENLATSLILDLNDLFENGKIYGRNFIESYKQGGISSIILQNAPELENSFKEEVRCNSEFRSSITLWWQRYEAEYANGQRELILAKSVITNWIGKFVFCNILKEFDQRAKIIDSIKIDTNPSDVLELFKQLSTQCNFWTVFTDSLGLRLINSKAWSQLIELNNLLGELKIGSIDQSQLSGLLEATVEVSIRKVKGQYPTPKSLAKLLIQLCFKDIPNARFLDPCCGSGTIARAAVELKSKYNTSYKNISNTIYAADLDSYSIQISSLAIINPSFISLPLRLFKHDVFDLSNDNIVEFRDPLNGQSLTENLGYFDVIATNLPFISQNGRTLYKESLSKLQKNLFKNNPLNGKSDVAAYIPFVLESMLKENGRLGIIITNAWLGTDWGNQFFDNLINYFDIKYIVTSGRGRWFKNAKVVANIMILEKNKASSDDKRIKFVVLKSDINDIENPLQIDLITSRIVIEKDSNPLVSIREVSYSNLIKFKKLGLAGNAQFVNCDWVLDLPLIPLNKIFTISRGERRGLNKFFYPTGNHNIEKDYLKPLLKSSKSFVTPQVSADLVAFSCNKSISELEDLGHTGAISWIKRFESPQNIEKLSKKNKFWYQMDANNLQELVMFINPGDRLFTGRVNPPAFVDQRMLLLQPKKSINVDFFHALLNSTIIYFFIEGQGFGRGDDVLDLSSDRVKKFMHILDVSLLNDSGVKQIIESYRPIKTRNVLAIPDELMQSDRQSFDELIIKLFSLKVTREQIYDSLIQLFKLRKAVKE